MTESGSRPWFASVSPPDEADVERRAWLVVRAAFIAREPVPRARRVGGPALALVAAAAVVAAAAIAAAASTPGRAVLEAVRDAVGHERVEPSQPSLVELPAPGRLLVNSTGGAWVVRADGSKRRLGVYREASWSPHGLFVVAVGKHELVALDPNRGPRDNLRWTLARLGRITDPRWAPGDGYRIAYLEGRTLRIVGGNGRDDHALDRRVLPGSLAWRPRVEGHVLAYVQAVGRLVVRDVDSGRIEWETNVQTPARLAWSPNGRRLIVAAPRTITVFAGDGRRLSSRALTGVGRFDVAADGRIALVRRLGAEQSELLLLLPPSLRSQRLFTAIGNLAEVAWSPGERWLVVGWPSADEWLFLRPGRANVLAHSDIARQFSSEPGAFPSIAPAGWCCR
jgi:hypothetical protein